jgi:hypothetical protein
MGYRYHPYRDASNSSMRLVRRSDPKCPNNRTII